MPSEANSPATADCEKVARIRRARPADPYIRLRLYSGAIDEVLIDDADLPDHDAHSKPTDICVAWTAHRPNGERWAVACGSDGAALVRLLEELHRLQPLDGVTVPAECFTLLPAHLTSPRPGYWSLWELPQSAHQNPGNALILDEADPRIRPLLTHSSSAHVFPGDRPANWAGVELGGELGAVGAEVREPNGLAHLVSICTHPDFRGRGLATATIGRLVQHARAQACTGVTLEMYADNESGRRAYRRAGFLEVGRYRSGLLDANRIARLERPR